MKKSNYLLFILLFLVSACSKPEKKAEAENAVKDNSITLPDIELSYKFEPGDAAKYRLTSLTNTTQTLQTDTLNEVSMTQTVIYEATITAQKAVDDSTFSLKINIDKINMSGNQNGAVVNYSSDSKLTGEQKKQFIDYETIVNHPYFIKLSDKGEIKEVSGVEKIVSDLLEAEGKNKTVSISERLSAIRSVKEGAVKPLTQQFFRVLPAHKVNTDSIWNFDYDTPLAVYQISNRAIFKLKKFEKFASDTLAKINASLSMTYTGNNQAVQNGVQYSFAPPEVSGEGHVDFNISKGLVQSSETTTRMQLSMVIQSASPDNQQPPAAEKDLTMTTNKLELLSIVKENSANK